jgi:Ca-activated chloride channel family protein
MTFTWPWALLALLVVPLVLGIAWWSRRRRRKAAVRVTSVVLVRAALPGRTAWRRRIPAVLLVLGLLVLGVGAARPQATQTVSTNSTTIILALDVSGSMCSTDVAPNRITAAEAAASTFIKAQPKGTRMGLVAFSGIAGEIVPPTTDSGKLLTAMKTLTTSRGTAIGEGILTSLDAIAAVDPSVPPTGANVTSRPAGYAADTIVLLTDGANTQGVTPAVAAQQAALRRVKVYTIGFGTTTPTAMVCDPSQVSGGGQFGGGGGGGFGYGGGRDGGAVNPLIIDTAALQQVASTSGGKYYRAQDASQLNTALKDLPSTITVSHKKEDLSHLFAWVGGLLALGAVGLSLWWNRVRRLPRP